MVNFFHAFMASVLCYRERGPFYQGLGAKSLFLSKPDILDLQWSLCSMKIMEPCLFFFRVKRKSKKICRVRLGQIAAPLGS